MCAVYPIIHPKLVNTLSTKQNYASTLSPDLEGLLLSVLENGTNFKGAFNELLKVDSEKVLKEMIIFKINWEFIPPTEA